MNSPARSICIAANDFALVTRNGGIGTHNWLLAHVLADAGWRVHVLYCGPVEDRKALAALPHLLTGRGIEFTMPTPEDRPEPLRRGREAGYVFRSEQVRRALERLHREHAFDLVEFADWGAVGFRTIQAQLSGSELRGARTIVKLHSPSSWIRRGARQARASADDVCLDFCERYAFEGADVRLSPSEDIVRHVAGIGWSVVDDVILVPNPFPEPLPQHPNRDRSAAREIVFFGRLETLKGLEIFVEAANRLDHSIRLTFLGKETQRFDGMRPLPWLRRKLDGRQFSFLTDMNRERALEYLAEGGRVAVIPSLLENAPYAVVECAVNGIPFLASRVGGIPDLLPDPDLQDFLLFEPTAPALHDALARWLDAPAAARAELTRRVRALAVPSRVNARVAKRYAGLAQPTETSLSAAAQPSLAVQLFCGRGENTADALASLESQSGAALDVALVVDGESPNAVAAQASDYVLVTTPAWEAAPDMTQRITDALSRRPELSALTSYYRVGKRGAIRPLGGPPGLASAATAYGNGPAVFRVDAVRWAGGGDLPDPRSPWSAPLARLVSAGGRVDVLPAYLFSATDAPAATSLEHTPLPQRVTARLAATLERFPHARRVAAHAGRAVRAAMRRFAR